MLFHLINSSHRYRNQLSYVWSGHTWNFNWPILYALFQILHCLHTRSYLLQLSPLLSIYHFFFADVFNKCKTILYTERERESAAMWEVRRWNWFLFIHRSGKWNGVKVNRSRQAIEVTFKRCMHLIKMGENWRALLELKLKNKYSVKFN